MSESEPVVQERIVVVALDFDGRPSHGSLEEDLVAAIADLGHQITVVSMDARTGPYAIPSVNALVDIRRVTVPPMLRRAPSILRRLWTQLLALREAATLRDLDPTRVVYFSPAFLALGPVWMLASRRRGGPVVVLVQWDFFPIHHEQIGRLPRLLSRRILKCLERSAIGVADTILVMSRKNAEFLARYHPGLSAHVAVQPPWGGKLNGGINASGKGRDQRFTVVFGGQLTAGRGVEDLLKAADLLQQRNVPVTVLIVGDGPDRDRLVGLATGLASTNVEFLGRLSRDLYLELLCDASVGVAITVPGVTIPSFPSKIVDYCRCGVPVITCTEQTSDVGEVIQNNAGGIAQEAGDVCGLADAIQQLYHEWLDGSISVRRDLARDFYSQSLTSQRAAINVLGARRRESRDSDSRRVAKRW